MHHLAKSFWLLVLAGLLLGLRQEAWAIPSFTRKYATSCSTCHTVYPVLNPFGKAFKASGYRIPTGDAGFVKDDPISLGAPPWKEVFPKAIWPSDIPGGSVAAFWLSSQFMVNHSAPITNEFDGLNELYLLGAGTLGESFSFFAELEIIERGTVPTDFGSALPRAFFQYNHPSHKFNVTYGLFEPRAVLTSTRLRLMRLSDYLSNRYGMPPTGNSFSLSPNQRGFEIWGNQEGPGNKGGLEWFFGVVNGRDAGTPSGAGAYGAEIRDFNRRLQAVLAREGRTNFENNSNKDIYFGANYKFGGMGVLGGGLSATDLAQGDNYVDNSITVGTFYYRGKAPTLVSEGGQEVLDRAGNTFHRIGAKVDIHMGKANILGGLQLNRDQVHPDQVTNATRDSDQVITLVEARYFLFPWIVPAVRFENLNPNYGVAFNRTTLHASILARANIRISVEGVLSKNSTTDPIQDYRRYDRGSDMRYQARLDFAF